MKKNDFKLLLQLTILLCCPQNGHSQRDHIWYFGSRAGVDFASGSPTALTNNQIVTFEGTSTVCDENGQLLFYTNGVRVFNRNHTLMPNGGNLSGGSSSTHAALSIQNPANPNRYYVFTTDEFVGRGVHYSEIDMLAGNGLGDVVLEDVLLLGQGCEKLAGVMHDNGTDTWIVAHQWATNAFYAWRVSAAGIAPPVISSVGSTIICPPPFIASAGQMKFSPDGSKLALANSTINLELFDFDTATGMVSNPLVLRTGYQYGVAFSPKGNALYATESVSGSFSTYQFNLQANDIPASAVQITAASTSMGWGMLNLAPDSKIYLASYGSTALSVIQKPDVIGLGCNFAPLAVPLAGRINFYGLPTCFEPGMYITGIDATTACTGNGVRFAAMTDMVPERISWDFGDGTFSNSLHPLHVYAAAGNYTVKVTARQNGYERYFSETISVLQNPVAIQPADLQLCDDNNDGWELFNLSAQIPLILGTQPNINFMVTFHLTPQDAANAVNPIVTGFVNTAPIQRIYARVSTVTGCFALTSFVIRVIPKPVIEMPTTYWICNENPITISAPLGFSGYLWSNSVTTRSIRVTQPGNYTLTVSQSTAGFVCQSTIAIVVHRSEAPVIKDLVVSDWSDTDNSILVNVSGSGTYEYSIDGVNYQSEPLFNGLSPGFYTVRVKDRNGCGADVKEAALLMYPKFFTPNGDGHNDTWKIKFAAFEPGLKIRIFDRYGKLLTTFKGDLGWDGNYSGSNLPATDYWFVVTRSNGNEHRGHFAMLR